MLLLYKKAEADMLLGAEFKNISCYYYIVLRNNHNNMQKYLKTSHVTIIFHIQSI